MTDRPIIFSGPMVRALIEGRKTQTRRVLKPQPWHGRDTWHGDAEECWTEGKCALCDGPPYAIGDRLWVRETWGVVKALDGLSPREIGMRHFYDGRYHGSIGYETDPISRWCQTGCNGAAGRWRRSIHMPRWASRLTLTVTDVKVERLQDISEGDACSEGVNPDYEYAEGPSGVIACGLGSAIPPFSVLWNTIHDPDAWDANPWIVALTFTVEQRNIDQ